MDVIERETKFAVQYLKNKQLKMKASESFRSLKEMGYTGSLRTLQRHIVEFNATNHALKVVKKDHNHPALNNEQIKKVDEWILVKNSENSPIGRNDLQKFILDTFNVSITTRTAGNIFKRLKKTIHTCQTKTSGYIKPNTELKTEYMGFISKMKKENKFYRHPSEIHSIDVTYSKKPPTKITTYSPKGTCIIQFTVIDIFANRRRSAKGLCNSQSVY
jgi:hypothetical protein